ncbi:MAG: ATP-binding protein [Clostridia bacterium]|nr:ATP-binding protein [Clostridia bacterium]
MKELSLNILDIVQNSVRANADIIEITIHEQGPLLTLTVKDNGHGMKQDFLAGRP